MPRWCKKERNGIREIRERLSNELGSIPAYPEVTGDRKLVRFLRGHNHDIAKVTEMVRNYLRWWVENNVGEIRNNIIAKGMDHPLKFPNGEFIMSLCPCLVLAPPRSELH